MVVRLFGTMRFYDENDWHVTVETEVTGSHESCGDFIIFFGFPICYPAPCALYPPKFPAVISITPPPFLSFPTPYGRHELPERHELSRRHRLLRIHGLPPPPPPPPPFSLLHREDTGFQSSIRNGLQLSLATSGELNTTTLLDI